MSCDRCGNALGTRPVLEMAEMFHQRPGVDSHGTGNLTGSVARTGLDGVIVQVRENLRRHSRGFRLSRHLTPQRNPLSWGSRQVSTRTDVLAIVGDVCKFLRWLSGSSVSMTPGERMFFGSASRFSFHINAVRRIPHSRSTKGATFRPVPCSALSEPSYLATTNSTTSRINAP